MLSWQEAQALIVGAGQRYHDDCDQVLGEGRADYRRCSGHANQMQNERAPRAIRRMMTGVVAALRRDGPLPPEVVVKRKSEIDADLSCVGTPSGVLDLASGRILPPDEARQKLVLTSTGVDYDPRARHPKVDEILPPIGPNMVGNTMAMYRAAILGYGLTHEPAREFMWEMCVAKSGKSTFTNALEQGLGKSYIAEIRPEALRPDPRRTASSHNGDLRRLAKPARFAFVKEFQGTIDAGIVKGASGGDDVTMRRIYIEDEVIDVTAHLWFMGNTQDEGGPQLGIANDDENARAILDRVKLLQRDRVPNPEEAVVNLREPEFGQAALARLVEYTMACRVLSRFPASPLSNELLLESQRQAEAADWQQDWLRNVVREKGGGDGNLTDACVTAVYESLRAWWVAYGTGRPPAQRQVTQAVNRHYVIEPKQGRCPQHGGKVEGIYPGHVLNNRPISLAL